LTIVDPKRLERVRSTERIWEVVVLVGGEGLSYVEAAARLAKSVRTIEGYAAEARALAGLPQSPQRACFLLYRASLNGNGHHG
jgi:hypothetical protein